MSIISLGQASAPLVVALDLGTSSARAILFDGLGRRIEKAESNTPYEMTTTPDGGVEIDADRLTRIATETIDELLTRVRTLLLDHKPIPEIEAVAVCTFWHSVLGVDTNDAAATPLYSWNDTRSAAAARELCNELDVRELHARTGCVPHASYWPAKLRWLRSAAPELFKRVSRWMSIGEYLYLKLFGTTVCSVSMASATGIFNQNDCVWDEQILSHLDITLEQLPPLADMDKTLTGLAATYRERWPELANARWFPALGDGACSNIGSGCVTRDRVALMIGTSGALRSLWEAGQVKIPPGLWCYRADRRRFVMGGALSNGGNLFAWMRDTLRLGPVEEVETELARMEADAHGLTVLPFLSGERSTGWAADARAAITGMSLDTTPIEILQAALESVAYRFAAVYDLIVREIGEPKEIIASGAAVLRSPAWAQIISDVIGREVIASAETEASSRGAALLALEALGAIAGIEKVEHPQGRAYFPNPDRHARYLKGRERQEKLYDALIRDR